MSRVRTVDSKSPEPAVIVEAVQVLRAGGLVAFPTETVYGLGARGLSADAVARIFAAKGRPATHPLILHVAGEEDAAALMDGDVPARVRDLMRAFWPGPLTLVVKKSARVPFAVTGGGDTVAIRSPDHPVALALIRALGEPVAAPSANRYQTISPTTAAHVEKSLGDSVDVILDGGSCTAGIESTVLDVSSERPCVLRPGALSLAALRQKLPDLWYEPNQIATGDGAHVSPGQDARHYAPRARVVLTDDGEAPQGIVAANPGGRVGVIALGSYQPQRDERVNVLPREPEGYGRALYAALHAMDDAHVDLIVIQGVPEGDAWAGVRDRLNRAATSAHDGDA
jgi:L-threonylcarbamoyladenylate synthase